MQPDLRVIQNPLDRLARVLEGLLVVASRPLSVDELAEAAADGRPTFVWANLVDFDQEYGHRNDPAGFARALEAFDAALPGLLAALPDGARLLVTADHGNDPTTPGTDHNREHVPVLLAGGSPRALGLRPSFAHHAATVAAYFGVTGVAGTSFLT